MNAGCDSPSINKGIDRIAQNLTVGMGHFRPHWFLKRPMLARIFFRLFIVRRDCSGLNPMADQTDFFGCQRLSVGRHTDAVVRRSDSLHDQTFGRISNDQCGPGVAAFSSVRRGVQSQTCLLLQSAVARVATFAKKRLHVPFVIH